MAIAKKVEISHAVISSHAHKLVCKTPLVNGTNGVFHFTYCSAPTQVLYEYLHLIDQ